MTTRRNFLKSAVGSATLLSLTPSVPSFLWQASAQAAGNKSENILVVVQLTGGNDGLNTVIPFADDEYYKNRFTLAIGKNVTLKINDRLGFHPSLRGFADLLDAGRLAVLQGVGYPNPDRSHFSSMDIWHSARREESRRNTGWLGRWLDARPSDGRDVPGLHLGGDKLPLAVVGQTVRVPSARSLNDFQLNDSGDSAWRAALQQAVDAERPAADDMLKFLQSSTTAALSSSQRVLEARRQYNTPVNYPGTGLGQQMRTVAQLIDAGLSTRIYYLTLDGFDTHAEQGGAHAGLLNELGGAVNSFLQDLQHHGHHERVMVMMFSEFGRRVRENASSGTDHGAAAPLFLAGGTVKPGVVGKHPSLTDLDDGDLKFHTDFRQVYTTVLEDWLRCDAASILGDKFQKVALLKS